MNPDQWDEFAGVLCDDPAERVGEHEEPLPYVSPLGNEPDWADIVEGRNGR